ncbi:MAG: hypothetical protein QM796_18915 [Chthoniobacteraceae bacterium]
MPLPSTGPFRFEGTNVYSDALNASGRGNAAFSSLRAEQIRADVNLRGIFRNVWDLSEVTVQQLAVDLTGPREAIQPPASSALSGPGWLGSWLPKKVELEKVNIRMTSLHWPNGSLKGTQVLLQPDGHTWKIEAQDGTVVQDGWPAARLGSARLRYNAPVLYLNDGELTASEGGTAHVTGQVDFSQNLDLHCDLQGVSVTPLLPPDWREKLHGALTGDIHVQADLPLKTPTLEGNLQLLNGRLEALPILDQIALFTGSQQFRTLDLSTAGGKFQQSGDRLQVDGFVAESAGLLRIEGAFTVSKGVLDGSFQVGVTASSLRWLPGSQEHVFNVSRDGYCWAPMRLTGSVDHPQEDLSPRLIAAAKQKVIDDATGTLQQTTDGVLDILKPLLH